MKKHCICILVKDRWDLTQKSLQSLYHTDQLKESYDLYLIDNGSSDIVSQELTEWTKSSIVPVKNLIRTSSLGVGPAWNLFLSITKDYLFRTKMDNDLIFANTPVAAKPFEREDRKMSHSASPGDAGTNPGAVPNASITMGAGNRLVTKDKNINHTCFLKHAEDAIRESKLGICAFPPVSVGGTLVETMPRLGQKTWRDNPLLVGGCMTITKEAFESLGYFNEMLPCFIDWEYSQRAMAAGINVGYTPNYCVIHLGEGNPTLSPGEVQKNELNAKMLGSQMKLNGEFVSTKWEKLSSKIMKASKNSTIVNLT